MRSVSMVEHDPVSVWTVLAATPSPESSQLAVAPVGTLGDAREILAGVDEFGDRHLLVPLLAAEQFRNAGAGRTVQLRVMELPTGRYASVVCRDRRLDDVFGQFARELMDAVQLSAKPGRDIRVAYDRWRALFAEQTGPRLSPSEQIGLLGELLLLKELLGLGGTCESWRGPDKASHDFRAGTRHIEVKSTLAREGLFVSVHGLEQLSVPPGEVLHLLVYRLEESAAGDSLTSVIREIEAATDDLVLFESQLRAAGFRWEQSGSYDTSYRLVELVAFDVITADFPRIVNESFVGGTSPRGTMQLTYVVDLSGPTPSPLTGRDRERVISAMAAG